MSLKIRTEGDKKIITVPQGERYISEWKDYSLRDFQFPHILDKKIPGCGYTEYCITNDLPIILCSPRRILLENKEQQHTTEVFYLRNELDEDLRVDKDLTKRINRTPEKQEVVSEERKKLIFKHLEGQLRGYLLGCYTSKRVPKILVTYDSFRLVKDILGKNLDDYYIVVDEMQVVFTDSRFKSTTEIEFMNQLKGLRRVCFVSATPMIEKYLKQIEYFKDLPYYELDWLSEDPLRVIKPNLFVRTTSSIVTTALEIIKTYQEGNFKVCSYRDQKTGEIRQVYSKELVVYVNSVNNITGIIKRCGLCPDEVNILCANTSENTKRIKSRLGRRWNIGKVPILGEPHKMFTFCTRTVYLGADFYSTCARTLILSDANIDSLAVDISLDLPQILGRQRLTENPWKNHAEFYYKTIIPDKSMTREVFDKEIARKIKFTNNLLLSYNSSPTDDSKNILAYKYEKDAINSNYKDDYIAVNRHAGSSLCPCLNELVLIAEQRAFDIQQVDYANRFSVFSTMSDHGYIDTSGEIYKFISRFEAGEGFVDKMKLLCETGLGEKEMCVVLDQIPLTYKNYYLTLGPTRLKALGYNITRVGKEYSDTILNPTHLKEEVKKIFPVGSREKKSVIKERLRDLYASLGYTRNAKASDLKEWFNVKSIMIYGETGERDNGFEVLSEKV